MQENTPFQGDKAMMHTTYTEITFSNEYTYLAKQVEGGACKPQQWTQGQLSEKDCWTQAGHTSKGFTHLHKGHFTHCSQAPAAMAMQMKCSFARRKKHDRCLGTRVAASNVHHKKMLDFALPYILPHNHKVMWHAEQWLMLKLIFFSYFPRMQQNWQR